MTEALLPGGLSLQGTQSRQLNWILIDLVACYLFYFFFQDVQMSD